MLFYLINLVIILSYGLFINCVSIKRGNKIFITLVCIHLGIIMACRSENVGSDTEGYSRLFYIISYSDDIFSVIKSAPLYSAYNYAVSLISTNTQCIIIFNSLIIITGMGIFIYRNSPNVVMSIYYFISLYFYFHSLNATRQFIATILIANSYYYLKNNNMKKFLILLVAAISIHNTASVFLIVWLLSKIKWSNFRICILAFMTTLIMYFYDKLLGIFLMVFPRYIMYMGGGEFSLSDTGQGKKILVSFLYLLIVALCMFLIRGNRHDDNQDVKENLYLLTAIMTVAVVIGIVFYNNLLISRIEIYFSIFVIIYIPLVIQILGKTNTKLNLLAHYFLMIITTIPLVFQLKSNISRVIPYEFFLD